MFLQPSIGSITKTIVTEVTVNDHLGNIQAQARRHQNTNEDP